MKVLFLLTILSTLPYPSMDSAIQPVLSCPGIISHAPCEEFWRYDTVFIGTVKQLVNEPFPEYPEGFHPYQQFRKVSATLSVDETFRGKSGPEIAFERADCYFEFKLGEKYLIYTNKGPDGKYDLRRSSSPTRLFAEASEDLDFIRSLPVAQPGGRVYGDVWDHRGSVTLRINKDDPSFPKMPGVTIYLRNGEKSFQTISDANGLYELTGLPAGEYELSTDLPNYLSGTRESVKVVDKGCTNVRLSVQATGEIKGRLVSANGEPIEKAVVTIFTSDGVTEDMFDRVQTHYMTRSETDKNGWFRFVRLRSGRYHLAVNMVEEERIEASPASLYPRMFHPDVNSFKDAKPIMLGNGAKLENVEIKLPAAVKQ